MPFCGSLCFCEWEIGICLSGEKRGLCPLHPCPLFKKVGQNIFANIVQLNLKLRSAAIFKCCKCTFAAGFGYAAVLKLELYEIILANKFSLAFLKSEQGCRGQSPRVSPARQINTNFTFICKKTKSRKIFLPFFRIV